MSCYHYECDWYITLNWWPYSAHGSLFSIVFVFYRLFFSNFDKQHCDNITCFVSRRRYDFIASGVITLFMLWLHCEEQCCHILTHNCLHQGDSAWCLCNHIAAMWYTNFTDNSEVDNLLQLIRLWQLASFMIFVTMSEIWHKKLFVIRTCFLISMWTYPALPTEIYTVWSPLVTMSFGTSQMRNTF